MREKGERGRVLSEGRKGEGRILIQTESVYKLPSKPYGTFSGEMSIKLKKNSKKEQPS